MRNKTLIDELDIDVQSLQAKKPQTEYKIQYIREYVLYWLKVSVNRDNIENINFIDCMCNAGIYQDGDSVLEDTARLLAFVVDRRNPCGIFLN